MELLPTLAMPLALLLLLTWLVLRLRGRHQQRLQPQDAGDTLAAWPPEASRVLSVTEREALDLVKRAIPGLLVLSQVPLSRFIRVPARHSYGEWLQRVGSVNADLLICDSRARVRAVIDIRSGEETARTRRRHERMVRVLRAAQIHALVWQAGKLPGVVEVRQALMHAMDMPQAEVQQQISSRPMPFMPLPEVSYDETFAPTEAVFDTTHEPLPSGFYDELSVGRAH